MIRQRVIALLVFTSACSAPGPAPDIAEAERHRKRGDDEAALAAYQRAQTTCLDIRDRQRRREACADAHLGRAELLVDLDRRTEAAEAFERAISAMTEHRAARARATLRAGQLRLDLGDEVRAYELLWRVVTDFPEEAFAADALKLVLRDGRRRDANQLYNVLMELAARLGPTPLGDNLLFALADLAENERDEPATARALYDRLISAHPQSGLFDDSLWHGARISRQLGDGQGAAERLRRLLATREVAFGAGSYFSVWLDNGQLELGRVLRDDLGDHAGAVRAFARLAEDYPASTLKDDALWETAQTQVSASQPDKACKTLAKLARLYPDSRWQLDRAPTLASDLGCAKPASVSD